MREMIRKAICLCLVALMVLSCTAFCFADEDVSADSGAPAKTYPIDSDYTAGYYDYDSHEMVVTFTGSVNKAEADVFAEEFGMTTVWPYESPAFTAPNVVFKFNVEASLGEMIIRVLTDDRVSYAFPNAPIAPLPTGEGPFPAGYHVPYQDYSNLVPNVDYMDGVVLVTFDLAVPDIPYAFRIMEDYGCVITDILSFDESFSAGKTVVATIVNGKTVPEMLDEIYDDPCIVCAYPNALLSMEPSDPSDPQDPQEPAEITVTRIAGKNRFETAFETAKMIKSLGMLGDNTIVVDGRDYPDALSGSSFSASMSPLGQAVQPILLTAPGVDEDVCKFIRELKTEQVYIIGGEAAVPQKFIDTLRQYVSALANTCKRVSGKDRYETNLNATKYFGHYYYSHGDVIVCSGKNYADAVSASATGLPILLVGDSLSQEQLNWLGEYAVRRCYIVGGEGAVSREIEEQISNARIQVVRLAGKDRYATSWKVADVFFVGADTVVLARGDNFADALSAGPLACALHAPILLVDSFENHGMARTFVFGSWAPVTKVYVMGGEGAISDKVVQWVVDPTLY